MLTSTTLKALMWGVLIVGSCVGKEGERRLKRKPVAAPPYAVSMEPLVHYSQRDPLYHENRTRPLSPSTEPPSGFPLDSQSAATHHFPDPERADYPDSASHPGLHPHSYYPPGYYEHPEPIIEIIIKESNRTLPAPPTPPPRPPTKEPVHVFYVKYKKNPNPKGDNDKIIYDPPIPALTPHTDEFDEREVVSPEASETVSHSPPPSTTLRTIIRPESETYHGGGIKVTFGSPEDHETELEEGSEPHPRLALPPNNPVHDPRVNQNYSPADIYRNRPVGHHGPTQFPNQPQTDYKPPNSNRQQTESSYNNNKYSPPSQEQILQYQQEKQYLYEQSLKLQASQPPPTFTPIATPQRFQQPSRPQLSQLQINFNNQRHVQQQQLLQQSYSQQQGPQQHQQQLQHHQRQHSHPHQQPYLQQIQHQQNQYQQDLRPPPVPPTVAINSQIRGDNSLHQRPQTQQPEFQPSAGGFKNSRIPSSSNKRPDVPYKSNSQYNNQQQINFDSNFKKPEQLKTNSGEESVRNTDYENYSFRNEWQHKSHHSLQPSISNAGLQGTKIPPTPETKPKPSFSDGEIVKSISQLEEHQVTPDFASQYYRESIAQDTVEINRQKDKSEDRERQHFPVYNSASTTSTTAPSSYRAPSSLGHFSPQSYTTPAVKYSSESTSEAPNSYEEQTYEDQRNIDESAYKEPENKTAVSANLAALPDEVPADLREQLLSSGILSNADIQILDYDKVGDIPIESLPPEALENFYGAGSEPVPSIVKPDKGKMPVEMKVVRYDPNTEEGQSIAKSYLNKPATQLDPIVLNDSKYNRYLPLKVNGTKFPIPDVPQLSGKIINSVVVLAPVDYDYIREKDEAEERSGKAIQVEGVRFVAGEALRDLVKDPSTNNFNRWLEQERSIPPEKQSVVLLVLGEEKNGEVFMYEVGSGRASKVRGELSKTFIEVAETNSSSQQLDGLHN